MPTPTLVLDKLNEAQLSIDGGVTSYTRTAIASDLNVTTGSEYEVLWSILQISNCPQPTQPLPNHGALTLQRIQANPIAGNCAFVKFYYSSFFGGPPSAFIIRDSSYLASFESDFLPGSGFTPIRCPGIVIPQTNVVDGSLTAPGEVIPDDTLTVSMLRTMRSISVTQLVYGQPNDAGRFAVGRVNSDNWRGLNTGFWLMSKFETDVARYSGYYQQEATALTKNDEDWSYAGVLVSRLTGRKAQPRDGDIAFVRNQRYAYGLIPRPGIVRVCPYQTTPFSAIFGF